MEKDKNGLYLANTGDLQQSRFLPLIQQAENAIKRMITKYLLTMGSVYDLRKAINLYIKEFDKKKLPIDIENRTAYIRGLYAMANKVFDELTKQRKEFAVVVGILTTQLVKSGYRPPKIANPKELTEYITKNKIKYDMWSQAKAVVRVQDYPNKIKEYIKKASEIPTLAVEEGKKPISVWQKAELDIRHEKQMEMLQEHIDKGEDLCWISSHPDCSKRCEKWQGKLVSLTEKSKMSGFRVKKVDGNWVYSLPDITAQVDKYGYTNNIIVGFNCFDKETEVLTNNGWKLFKDLETDDLVYTLNPKTRITEWQKPINYFSKHYNGKMMKLTSSIADLLVTPNHQMLYFMQHNKELRFEDAEKTNKCHWQYAGQNWVGKDKSIIIGGIEVDSKIFCRLLGYWLADGSIHCNNAIKIAQQNNDQMWENLQALPFKLWRDKNKIIVRNKELTQMLKPLGKCTTKYIFKWVKELPKESLNELLNAYIFTDGYTSKPKTINGYMRKPHKTVFTTSKQMCADLCEIALKCGYRPKIELRADKGKVQKFKNGTYTINNDMYVIHLNYAVNFVYKNIEKVDYDDMVYCVEVPNHTLLVKRNGCIQWCGNCRHKLIAYTGQQAPKDYDADDIKKMREIGNKIRQMERNIRAMKTEQTMARQSGDMKQVRILEIKIKKAINELKMFCDKNGFAFQQYRVK